jgi:colanic acid/amylovoran biosynthesis glycosyltransferase
VLSVGYVLRYWPTVSETFVARELTELLRRGISAEVVALGQRPDARWAPPSAVPVLRPPRGRGTLALVPPLTALSRAEVRAVVRWASRHLRPRDVARALWVAEQGALRGWSRLHVHFAGEAVEWARVAAAALSVPYTVTVHAVDLFVPRPSLREVLRDAACVITVCEHHRRWMAERYAVEATVIRCGVPTEVAQAEPGAPGARFVCVARDVPKKGLDELVAAMEAVPEATLRLVSDGVRLGGPRVLAGPLPPGRVPGVLARAHAFVLPCRIAPDGDRDGVPVALLEAMAAGLPVVSTAVSGVGELVDDEVGWLVPSGDPGALRRALRQALSPSERARRGAAARHRVIAQRWTVERQVDELLGVWV